MSSDHPDSLFCSKEDAARLLGMSVGGLGLAMQRGECEGLYTRLGRRILFCLPAIQLRALGVSDVGSFCKSLGIRNLSSLLEFLSGANLSVRSADSSIAGRMQGHARELANRRHEAG
jgi:hypothetical protein